jgi:hypothetical protein
MIESLAAEIATPAYAGMSDDAILAAVNAKRVVSRRLVPTWEIRRAAIEGGYWPSLVLAAADSSSSQRQGLAISVLAWIDDQSGTIQAVDMDRPSTEQMIAGLVAAELVTQSQADALAALADADTAWTESVGLPEIGIGLLNNARRING